MLCSKCSQKYILMHSQRIEVVSVALTILSFPGPFLKKAEISSSFFGLKRRGGGGSVFQRIIGAIIED